MWIFCGESGKQLHGSSKIHHTDELNRAVALQTGLYSCPGLRTAGWPCFADCGLAVLDWPANWPEVNSDAPIKNTDEHLKQLGLSQQLSRERMIASKSHQTDAVIPLVGAPKQVLMM